MKRALGTAGLVLWAGLALACASSGGEGGALENKYTHDFGRLLLPALEDGRNRVWSRHNYHLNRQEQDYNSVYYESQWRPWAVEDGAWTDARIRIVIRGRRVASELDGSGLYRVYADGEYEVTDASGAWQPQPPPEAVRKEFDKVFGDLALEVRTGVRR